MIRTKTKNLISNAMCLVVAFASIRAQAQSSAEASEENNRTVEAFDASVHAEVDGHPHEGTPAESSARSATTLHAARRLPTAAVWSAHTDSYDKKAGSLTYGISSFLAGTQPGAPSATRAIVSANVKNKDSGRGQPRFLTGEPTRLLYGGATPILSLKPTVPPESPSREAPGLSAPFGRTRRVPASAGPFPTGFSEQGGPAHRPHAQKDVTKGRTKSSLGSPATTLY